MTIKLGWKTGLILIGLAAATLWMPLTACTPDQGATANAGANESQARTGTEGNATTAMTGGNPEVLVVHGHRRDLEALQEQLTGLYTEGYRVAAMSTSRDDREMVIILHLHESTTATPTASPPTDRSKEN